MPGCAAGALLPVALLVLVAGAQVTLARRAGLSPWKGGGFGMFSTTDDAGRRHVRVFVTAPERSEEIAIAPSLEDAARRAAVLPATPSSRASRSASSSASAGYHRPVDSGAHRGLAHRVRAVTLAATSRLIREFVYRVDPTAAPHRDDDGVPDSSSR